MTTAMTTPSALVPAMTQEGRPAQRAAGVLARGSAVVPEDPHDLVHLRCRRARGGERGEELLRLLLGLRRRLPLATYQQRHDDERDDHDGRDDVDGPALAARLPFRDLAHGALASFSCVVASGSLHDGLRNR